MEKQGSKSDLKIFRESKVKISKKVKLKADLGYVGIEKTHLNSKVPIKKPKGGELGKNEKKKNKRFRRQRVKIEHTIRRCKIFRIVKERFRNCRDGLENIWLIVCGLVNLKS